MLILFLIELFTHTQPFWTWICHHVFITALILLCLA